MVRISLLSEIPELIYVGYKRKVSVLLELQPSKLFNHSTYGQPQNHKSRKYKKQRYRHVSSVKHRKKIYTGNS